MDLLETAEQRYARIHGSCDFRDSSVASPLDRGEEMLTVVIDPRDPRALRSSGGWTQRDAPAPLRALATRLAERGAELGRCTSHLRASNSPINVGASVSFKLVPTSDSAAGPRVERHLSPDTPVVGCIGDGLALLVAGLRIDQRLQISVVVPEAMLPPELAASPVLDNDAIRRVIHGHIDEVRQCYEAAIEVWPDIQGRVAVRFAIDTKDGHVLDARVAHDDTGQSALACCVARTVYGWRFQGNGTNAFTIVTYPFVLESVPADPP